MNWIKTKLKSVPIYYWLITLFGLLLVRQLFLSGYAYTHDGHNHIARLANFWLTLKSGQWPPRFAPNLDNGFGYPVFNFNFYLPYFISLIFKIIGFSYQVSFKLTLGFFYLLGGWGVFRWLSDKTNSNLAFLSSLIYLATPYQFSNIFVRGNIGELAAIGLLPWVLYSLDRFNPKKNSSLVYTSLVIAAFWLSHNLVTILGLPFIALYHLLNFSKKDLKTWWTASIKLGLLTTGLVSFFYLPALAEKRFITLDHTAYVNHYLDHFVALKQLVSTHWSFGYSIAGFSDLMSFSLGAISLLLLASSLVALCVRLIKSRKPSSNWPQFIFFTLSLLAIIFLMNPISTFIYRSIPILAYLQFPWRWLLLSPLLISAIFAFTLESLKFKPTRLLVIIIALALAVQAWPMGKMKKSINYSDQEYAASAFTSSTLNENTSTWFDRDKAYTFSNPYLITNSNPNLNISIIRWDAHSHVYSVKTDVPIKAFERTAYFPGWELYLNDQHQQPIKFQEPEYPGVVSFNLPAGDTLVKTVFTQNTPARAIGNLITFLSLSLVTWYLFFAKKIKSFKPNLVGWGVSLALGFRVVLQFLAHLINVIITFKPSFPYSETLLEVLGNKDVWRWANFDGVHYLRIIKNGYHSNLSQAFFPMYPIFSKVANLFLNNPLYSSLTISNLCFLGFVYFFIKLGRLDFSAKDVKFSLLSLLIFPTSFYFFAAYNESLFLLLTASSLYYSRQKKFALASVLVSLAAATRLVGLFLIPALLWEYWQANNNKIKLLPMGIYTLIASTGFLSYLYFLKKTFNDSFIFIHSQPGFGGGRQVDKLVMFYQVVFRYIKMLFTVSPSNDIYPILIIELFLSLFFLAWLIYALIKKLRSSYLIFIIPAFLLPTLTGTFSSMPRYVLACFPLFYLLPRILKKSSHRLVWLTSSTILLIYLFSRFISGYWVS